MFIKGCVFYTTGSAGTGKSFLLRHIIAALPPEKTVATASTGAAACLVAGTTLHAFAGWFTFTYTVYKTKLGVLWFLTREMNKVYCKVLRYCIIGLN